MFCKYTFCCWKILENTRVKVEMMINFNNF